MTNARASPQLATVALMACARRGLPVNRTLPPHGVAALGFGGREAKPVILKAKQGLQRVLSQPDLLLNKNISELRRAFSRAQFLAIRRGFSHPNCRYP